MSKAFALLTVALAAALCGPTMSAASTVPRAVPTEMSRDTSRYRDQNSWVSYDKQLHFAISAAGSSIVYGAARELGLGRWSAAGASAFLMGTAGVLREIANRDRSNLLSRDHISRKDLVWDGVGIVVGISATELVLGSRWRGRRAAASPHPVVP